MSQSNEGNEVTQQQEIKKEDVTVDNIFDFYQQETIKQAQIATAYAARAQELLEGLLKVNVALQAEVNIFRVFEYFVKNKALTEERLVDIFKRLDNLRQTLLQESQAESRK